jgi:hypothetical protein
MGVALKDNTVGRGSGAAAQPIVEIVTSNNITSEYKQRLFIFSLPFNLVFPLPLTPSL